MTDLTSLLAATWPPAATTSQPPWTLRNGQGGGKRVSAATANGPVSDADIDHLEQAMRHPLVAVLPHQTDLDTALAARGYTLCDPTLLYAAPLSRLITQPPPVTGFSVWPPLQIQRDIWAEGGIGPERIAVMERVATPKISLLGRTKDQAASAAFVAVSGQITMIHAIETRPHLRRAGAARHLIAHAAAWARDQGATTLTLLVTQANGVARNLYTALGMTHSAGYHYRIKGHEQTR